MGIGKSKGKGKGIRTLVLTACTAILALSLAGCSSSNSATSNGSVSNTGNDTSTNSSTTNNNSKARGKITVAVYDYGNIPKEQGSMDKNWATDWINKNGPVDVQFVPIPRWTDTQKYNVLFASGEAPDLIWSYDPAFKGQLIDQKQLMPLEDIIDKYSTTYKKLLEDNPGLRKLSTAPDGHIYQIGRVNGLQPNHVLLIRNDWLKKLNLSVPKTTEEFMKVAEAFAKQDPDGNNKADTYGTTFVGIAGQAIDFMFGNNTSIVLVDGKLNVQDWDRIRAETKFKKQLFDAGIVDKDYLNDKDGSKAKQEWVTGKIGIYGMNATDLATYSTFMENNPDADVIAIPLPSSPFGQFSPAIIPPIQIVGGINANAKDPKAVMQYIDFLTEQSTMTELSFGEENTDYKVTNGCPQKIDSQNPKLLYTEKTFNMLKSSALFGECASYLQTLHPDENPVEKKWGEIYTQATQDYLSPERPWPGATWFEFMPSLPSDLQTYSATLLGESGVVTNIMTKALIVGNAQGIDAAVDNARNAWNKSGGAKIDAWWENWYTSNKDKAYLTKDLYVK